jgi:hypothetical protein
MTLTRTRLGIIAIIGALIVLSIACGSALSDREGDGAAGNSSLGSGNLAVSGQTEGEPAAFSANDALREGSAPGGSAGEENLQGLLDRKIIQSTSIDIAVEEVGRNFQEIIRIAETAGGFVASSTFSNVDDEQVADLTIRVPSDRYQDVLAQIRGMGEVEREGSDANDVTEEFTDRQARLRTLEATERRYLELLAEADGINEILLVQDRLDGVRGQIEQVQGRINLLENLTDLATITVHLRPPAVGAEPPADGNSPLEAAAAAWDLSLDTLRALATGILVTAAFSWWLVPPLAAFGIGARWWLRRRPPAAPETSA